VAEAYDGELNPMTFNHVKSSKAFDMRSKTLFSVENNEEFEKWLANTNSGQLNRTDFMSSNH